MTQLIVGAERGDVSQNAPPAAHQLPPEPPVVLAHRLADPPQIVVGDGVQQTHEMLGRVEVDDVRKDGVPVAQRRPVLDAAAVVGVRVRHAGVDLRRVGPQVGGLDADEVDLVHDVVAPLPVGKQGPRREEQRHVHAVQLECRHRRRLQRQDDDAAVRRQVRPVVRRVQLAHGRQLDDAAGGQVRRRRASSHSAMKRRVNASCRRTPTRKPGRVGE